jgi:phosphatidylserine decarboxylase
MLILFQVSPCDGKVLHFGVVKPDGYIEQVKGVTYRLDKFLGSHDSAVTGSQHIIGSESTQLEKCLYHIIIYLAPGDYHHFHSPTDWTVNTRRHFPGSYNYT